MANWDEIKAKVEKNNNVLTLTMNELRTATGKEKLGVHVRKEIGNSLISKGLNHIPQELPSHQHELVRLYKRGTPIGDLIDTVLSPGEQDDWKLKEQFPENTVEDKRKDDPDMKSKSSIKIDFEAMLASSGSKEAEYIEDFKDLWKKESRCTIEMGRKGFSVRYDEVSLIWMYPDYIQISGPIVQSYKDDIPKITEVLNKYFDKLSDKRWKLYPPKNNDDSISHFVDNLRRIGISISEKAEHIAQA